VDIETIPFWLKYFGSIAIFFAVLIFVVRTVSKPHKEKTAKMRMFVAQQTGLSLYKCGVDETALRGQYHGRNTELHNFIHSSVGVYLRARCEVENPNGISFRLKSALRTKGLTINDERFDNKFSLHGKPESAVQSLFKDTVLDRLLDAAENVKAFEIELRGTWLSYQQPDFGKSTQEHLLNIIEIVNEIGIAVDEQ